MRIVPRVAMPLAMVAVIASCRHLADAPIGVAFPMEPGQSVNVTGTHMTLTFVRVESDSRCPRDVTCIQAGEAVATFAASGIVQQPDAIELHLPGGTAADTTVWTQYHDYRLRLVTLEPEPAGGIRTDSTAYQATVIVRR